MNMTPDLPGPGETQTGHDDDAMFDELAARAGAALRRPAPEDGVTRHRRPAATPASSEGDRGRRDRRRDPGRRVGDRGHPR